MSTQTTEADVAEYRLRMELAWKEVEKLTAPAHMTRTCQADLDSRDFALRRYQNAKYQYLEACKMAGVQP